MLPHWCNEVLQITVTFVESLLCQEFYTSFDLISPFNSLGAITAYFREKEAWALQLAGDGPHLSLLNSEMLPLDYCVCCAEAVECFRIVTVYVSISQVWSWSESRSVVSSSLWPHGLYSPWDSPGQDWVAFLFSRGSSQLRDWTQVSCIAGGFFTSWATRKAQEYWNEYPIPSPADLPNPGIQPGFPALQTDSLPTELWEKPIHLTSMV